MLCDRPDLAGFPRVTIDWNDPAVVALRIPRPHGGNGEAIYLPQELLWTSAPTAVIEYACGGSGSLVPPVNRRLVFNNVPLSAVTVIG